MSTVKIESRQLVASLDDEFMNELPFSADTPLRIGIMDGRIVVEPVEMGRTMSREKFDEAKKYVFEKYDNALRKLAE